MRAWLQRDDVRHSVKLTATFVVVLVAQIVIAAAVIFVLSLVGVISTDASTWPSVAGRLLVLVFATSAAGTYSVHRGLRE